MTLPLLAITALCLSAEPFAAGVAVSLATRRDKLKLRAAVTAGGCCLFIFLALGAGMLISTLFTREMLRYRGIAALVLFLYLGVDSIITAMRQLRVRIDEPPLDPDYYDTRRIIGLSLSVCANRIAAGITLSALSLDFGYYAAVCCAFSAAAAAAGVLCGFNVGRRARGIISIAGGAGLAGVGIAVFLGVLLGAKGF